jgi:predicted nucleotidyltransferase
LTKEGIRLRGAVAGKPIRRETADRLLSELVERIATLNRNGHFRATVRRAVVFGSYLGHADRIGDVDVAIELVRREANFDKHMEMNMRRVAEESERGRHFANMVEEAYWWQREAMLFLRNRRRGLSLQAYAAIRKIVDASPHRVLFEDRESVELSEAPNL